MTWEEHEKFSHHFAEQFLSNSNREQTDIECPMCWQHVYRRTDIILTTYPPKNQYECDSGWVGYSAT